jgi:hypothetical protein
MIFWLLWEYCNGHEGGWNLELESRYPDCVAGE